MTITKLGDVARTRHINDVVGSYGFELEKVGRNAMQTRCPRPHKNGNDTRASLTLYEDSQRFYCFGCRWWGDSLDFIQEMERLSLQEAAGKLQRNNLPLMKDRPKPPKRHRNPRRDGVLVAAAVEFYSRLLFKEPEGESGRTYCRGRNVDRATARMLQIGYGGGGLAKHLTEMGYSVERQMRSGLFLKYPQERFDKMVIVPEIRDGKPVWMTGRAVIDEVEPKFQAMPGSKPSLGIGTATPDEALIVTEGVFDYIALKSWGINAVALCGNGNIEKAIAELKRARPTALVFAFDSDEKTLLMMQQLSAESEWPVSTIQLPEGVGDVADLGMLADGRERFEIALLNTKKVELEDEISDSGYCGCGNSDCGGCSRNGRNGRSADKDGRADHRVEAVDRAR